MNRKVFVSYKYHDSDVYPLEGHQPFGDCTARGYVDYLYEKHGDSMVFKGEPDGEDLSLLSEEVIASKLYARLYDSSVTVILVSPNMRDYSKSEKDQWIPREISYSLKEVSRRGRTSVTNGMIAVVLPDRNGSYDYAVTINGCCKSGCRTVHADRMFKILRDNMFNKVSPDTRICSKGDTIWRGSPSYIPIVKWSDFINDFNRYVEESIDRHDHIADYKVSKEISDE